MKFPIDKDTKGKLYPLESVADHLVRSKVLYHPNVLQEKKRVIEQGIESKNNRWIAKVMIAKKIELDNMQCEKLLAEKMGIQDNVQITKEIIEGMPIHLFEHPNASLLSAFIKIHELSDLTKSLYIPNKGTLQEVLDGHKDKKGWSVVD